MEHLMFPQSSSSQREEVPPASPSGWTPVAARKIGEGGQVAAVGHRARRLALAEEGAGELVERLQGWQRRGGRLGQLLEGALGLAS